MAIMLKHRVMFGALMYALLGGILCADAWLDEVRLVGTFWQPIFAQRHTPPPGLLMFAVVCVLVALAAVELCSFFHTKGIKADRFTVVAAALTGCAAMYLLPQSSLEVSGVALATAAVVIFVAAMVSYSWRHQRVQGAIAAAGVVVLALVYLGLAPGFFLSIRIQHSAWVVAGVIVVTKFGDSGAYFTGRLIGRHKLVPWLSPNKTWEGLFGALAASMLTAMAVAWVLNVTGQSGTWVPGQGSEAGHRAAHDLPIKAAAIAGLLLGLVGHLGDLVASLLKRDAGLKDSGRTIPGFGGLIDVFDSPILAAPMAYWLLRLAQPVG